MNWLDWLLLILIVGSIVASVRKGFSRELIGLISMIVALFSPSPQRTSYAAKISSRG